MSKKPPTTYRTEQWVGPGASVDIYAGNLTLYCPAHGLLTTMTTALAPES
jgi:hypothetical protein